MNVPKVTSFLKINLLLALAYFGAGLVCSSISGNSLVVPVLFVPEAISLAAALLFGWQCAFGVFFGQLALATFNDANIGAAIGISLVNGFEVIIAAWLSRRWKINPNLSSINDYSKLMLLIFVVLQPFSALFSNAFLWVFGQIQSAEAFWHSSAIWASSNILGQALVTPPLLALFLKRDAFRTIAWKALSALFLMPAIAVALFAIDLRDTSIFVALLLPVVIFTAYYLELPLFSLSAALTAIVASVATSHGLGSFVKYQPNSYAHLSILFFGTLLPAQMISLLFKQLSNERKQVESLSEERVQFLTYFDPLTKLPNRALSETILLSTLENCKAGQSDAAVILIDLDDFRHVNDAYGQSVGDAVLQRVVTRIRSSINAGSYVCRVGGDEFLVILSRVESRAFLNALVKGIMDGLTTTIQINDKKIDLAASCGILTIRPKDNLSPEMVMRSAEAALYSAKKDGKNLWRYYSPQLQESTATFASLTEGLRMALDRKELSLSYQPQINLETGAVVGAEALLNWRVPGLGLLSPSTFIAIAERSGLIVPIGEWVLRSVCEQIAVWNRKGLSGFTVSVNVSPAQVHRSDVGKQVQSALAETGIDPARLNLEITESILLQHDELVTEFLKNIERSGVKLAIDDFGVGFSNLSYIRRLDISRIKIDKSFIAGMANSEADQAIVKSIVELADGIGAIAVAEGVEDEATLESLKSLGCKQVQGYYYSRPLDAESFEKFLQSNTMRLPPEGAGQLFEQREHQVPKVTQLGDSFRLFFENAPIGMALVDHATGNFKDVNQTLLDWTGYRKAEFLALSYWDLTPRKYDVQELAQIEELNHTGKFGPNYKEYIRKDGSSFPIKISGFKALDVDGNEIVWGVIDKLEALPTQTHDHALAPDIVDLNILFDVVCMVNESGEFVYLSQAAERIFGYTPDEMVGRKMIEFVHEGDKHRTIETARQVVSKGYVHHFENRYVRKDGGIVHVMWTARWSDKDGLRIAVARDITDRKRREQLLSTLYEISEASNRASALKEFLQSLRSIIAEQLAAQCFMVILNDADTNQLRLADAYRLDGKNDHESMLVAPTLSVKAFESDQTIVLKGDELNAHEDYPSLSRHGPISAWVAVPLRVGQSSIGLLVMTSDALEPALKNDVDVLEHVANQVAAAIDRLRLRALLSYRASYDNLTKIPNRSMFYDRFNALMTQSAERLSRIVVLYLDVDDFKLVNDTYGHKVGDSLLQIIAERISACVQPEGFVARLAGDEFACLLETGSRSESTGPKIREIEAAICRPIVVDGHELAVSVSMGFASYPDDGATADEILSVADKLMYKDKRHFKDTRNRLGADWTF